MPRGYVSNRVKHNYREVGGSATYGAVAEEARAEDPINPSLLHSGNIPGGGKMEEKMFNEFLESVRDGQNPEREKTSVKKICIQRTRS